MFFIIRIYRYFGNHYIEKLHQIHFVFLSHHLYDPILPDLGIPGVLGATFHRCHGEYTKAAIRFWVEPGFALWFRGTLAITEQWSPADWCFWEGLKSTNLMIAQHPHVCWFSELDFCTDFLLVLDVHVTNPFSVGISFASTPGAFFSGIFSNFWVQLILLWLGCSELVNVVRYELFVGWG